MALREPIMGKALIFEPVNTGWKPAHLRGLPNGCLPIVNAFSGGARPMAGRQQLLGGSQWQVFHMVGVGG